MQSAEPVCRKEDNLIALVTGGGWELGVPRFELGSIDEIAAFIAAEFIPPR